MSESICRWGILGAADIARKNWQAIRNASNGTLTAVASRDLERCRRFVAQCQSCVPFSPPPRACGSYEELLSLDGVDAVYLPLPTVVRKPWAIRAAEAGKHVLVEKPLGLRRADCEPAIAAAAAAGTTAGCAYYRRLYPAFRHTQEFLASGQLGRLVLGRLVCYSWWAPAADDPKRWRVVRAEGGGGPLADVASHMLDVLVGLAGMPTKVQAYCAALVHGWDVEDTATVALEMPDGAQISGAFAWSCGAWRHEFELVGSQARVSWQPFDSGKVIITAGRDIRELDLPPAANVHLPLVEDFVEAVRTGRSPACPLAEAARTNALLDAVYAAASTGVEVCL